MRRDSRRIAASLVEDRYGAGPARRCALDLGWKTAHAFFGDIARRGHVAIGMCSAIQLHARPDALIQRQFVNRDGAFSLIQGPREMPWRIQMCAIVGRDP